MDSEIKTIKEIVLPIAYYSEGHRQSKDTLLTIWEQMLEMRLKFCLEECQSNRGMCILRPKCKNRRFLDILLLQQKYRDRLPSFCYSYRLKELERAHKTANRMLEDVYIKLEDFWKLIPIKSLKKDRHFTKSGIKKLLREISKKNIETKFVSYQNDTKNLILIGTDIFLIDLNLKLCLINPQTLKIGSFDEFSAFSLVFSQLYDLKSEIKQEKEIFAQLIFTVNVTVTKEDLLVLARRVPQLVAHHGKNFIFEYYLSSPSTKYEPPTVAELSRAYEQIKLLIPSKKKPKA